MLMLYPYLNKMRLQCTCLVAVCTASMSFGTTWSLWIHSGVGNANTFFTTTLIYNTPQILFVSNAARAYLELHLAKVEPQALNDTPKPAADKGQQQQRKQHQDSLRDAKVDQLSIDHFLLLDKSMGNTLQRRRTKAAPEGKKEGFKAIQKAQAALSDAVTAAEARLQSEWLTALGREFSSRLGDDTSSTDSQVVQYFERRCNQVVAGGASGLDYLERASEFIVCSERCFARRKASLKNRVAEVASTNDSSDKEDSKKKSD